jgi:elongation factor G
VTTRAEAEVVFDRPMGGSPQYARVHLAVEPMPSGEGFRFEDATRGKALPPEFVKAVEEGCREAMESGVLAGYPLVDVKAVLLDAEWREEVSTEAAFKVAGSMAFREAVEQAEPVLLEPVMDLEAVVPEAFTGEVIGDLNARGANIISVTGRPDGIQAIRAQVPLAKMFGYATDIRSLTQGRGTFTMEFHHYAPVDKERMDAIIYGGTW